MLQPRKDFEKRVSKSINTAANIRFISVISKLFHLKITFLTLCTLPLKINYVSLQKTNNLQY